MTRLTSALLITLGILASSPVMAEDEATPAIPKPLNVMPVKIKPVQGATDELSKAAPDSQTPVPEVDSEHLETLNPRGNYGFQSNFWENSNRKDLVQFLSIKEGITPTRSLHDLTLRAVLTPAPDISSSSNPAENLYSLRLQRLVNLGDFEDALTLYKLNENTPPTPLAASAGIEAMLGSGQIAVACLEQKALDAPSKADAQLWTNIDTFCQALLSPVAGNDNDLRLSNASRIFLEASKVPTPATAAELNKLDIVSTIALAKSNKMAALLSLQTTADSLTDKKIAILLSYATPLTKDQFPILATALKRGLISDDDALTKLATLDTSDPTNTYGSFLKEYLKEKPPTLTAQLLDLATTSTQQALLLPLYAAQEVAFPENKKMLSLKLLATANQPIPANLARGAFLHTESPTGTEESGEKLLFSYLFGATKSDNTATYSTLLALKPLYAPDNPQKSAYDNILSLTVPSNYVMPNAEILSTLKKSANEKQADQVVIKSLEILSETPLDHLHPAALNRILEALNSAGLSEETMSLSRDVLGTLLEKN